MLEPRGRKVYTGNHQGDSMKKITASLFGLTISLAASTAFAADTGTKAQPKINGLNQHPLVREADTNNDGTVSKDEWKIKGDKILGEIDANGDGQISSDEMNAYNEKLRGMK